MQRGARLAASGKRRPLTLEEMRTTITDLNLKPSVQELTPTAQPVG